MRAVFALRLRSGLMLFGGACLLAPSAAASSFVAVAPPKGGLSSSFVALGEPPTGPAKQAAGSAPPKPRSALDAPPDYAWEPGPVALSPSIVAFGEPPVEVIKVASIPKPAVQPKPGTRPRPAAQPKVIRAGIVGHAFPEPVAAKASLGEKAGAKAPEPAMEKPGREQPDPAPPPSKPPTAMRGPELGKPE